MNILEQNLNAELRALTRNTRNLLADYTYEIPQYVDDFLFKANMELPTGSCALPHTSGRMVNIIVDGEKAGIITYEKIEESPIHALCAAIILAKNKSRESNNVEE